MTDYFAGTGSGGEFEFNWILDGEHSRWTPYITYKQKFGLGGLNAGGGLNLSASYKTKGDITPQDLITPMNLSGTKKLEYFGRESSVSVLFINASYENSKLPGGAYLNTYSIGVGGDIGNESVFGGSVMSTFTIPLNF